jgi:hypothetical protein
MNKVLVDNDTNAYIFTCVHCNLFVLVKVSDINCKIFRHGAFKDSGEPINPHETLENCNNLLQLNKVYGCCKPLQIIEINKELFATSCDFI